MSMIACFMSDDAKKCIWITGLKSSVAERQKMVLLAAQSIRNRYCSVEHTYEVCPKYSKLGSFRIIAYLYVRDGYSVLIYSEAETHAVYAIYKQILALLHAYQNILRVLYKGSQNMSVLVDSW